ncbi:MAG: class I SAM-dependent methyltransferase, partial [Gemmatimonadota bacterium]|nr:class I SAM-dependent methyltransferase [Gemmatimonadota bacterium]
DVPRAVSTRLRLHYEELRRWSKRLSLIGPGTGETVVARHYGESLAALDLLDSGSRLVDVGSGAGFPGWVLAAARSDLEVWLVESRGRKAAFLEAATRRAALSCRVLSARVGRSLPEGFPRAVDIITVRAVRLVPREWYALSTRLSESGRILRWVGPAAPSPPSGFVAGRRIAIGGTRRGVEELLQKHRKDREE